MADLFEILPMAILYLACGFTFLCGFYMLIDRRFDFFSDISFSIMLVCLDIAESISEHFVSRYLAILFCQYLFEFFFCYFI